MINRNTGYKFEGDHGGVYGKGRFKGRKRRKEKGEMLSLYYILKNTYQLKKMQESIINL